MISTIAAAPMRPQGTCGPEEDLACYPDGSNGKRSPASVTPPKLPTITKPTIPPLGAPTGGIDGVGYLRRSVPTEDGDSIVIGSKRSPAATEPSKLPKISTDAASYVEDAASYEVDHASYQVEDVGAYDEEKKRSLSLDAKGHPILTGENYLAKRARVIDGEDYPGPEDVADYGKRAPRTKQPIDGDYPKPNDASYPVKAK